ncbi:MAG: hypothetical protein NVS4B6_09570 [Mycobacterium sp.]
MTDVINDEKGVVDLDATQSQPGVASGELVRQLAERARAEGLRLIGEGGLLSQLTKVVVESALEGELDDHLGYGKHDPAGPDGGNSRNGRRGKSVLTEAGSVSIEVPRDREGSFEPRPPVGVRVAGLCPVPAVRQAHSHCGLHDNCH